MNCVRCGDPILPGAVECATCVVTPDPAALAALEASPGFARARGHKPSTNWIWIVPLVWLLAAGMVAGAVVAGHPAGQIVLGGLALLCGYVGVKGIGKLLRPPRPHVGTLMMIGKDSYRDAKGRTVTSHVFGLELPATGKARFGAHTSIPYDGLSYGDPVIAFVDDDTVYEIWTGATASAAAKAPAAPT